ncbi:MAG: DUF1189 family protein [Candidatus Moranbacteria bacterium]|nr:DUF1189 family protein [Candidatus Moranbacteria bacterium]
MKFFQMVKDSIYNPRFYRDIAGQSASVSVKYFAKLVLVVSCIIAIIPLVGGIGLLTWKQASVENFRSEIIATFPAELSVRIKNGEISTNVQEPYAIAMPENLKREIRREKDIPPVEQLLVIDTTKPIQMSDFETHQTLVMVGKNQVGIFNPGRGKVEVQNIQAFNIDYTLDRSSFTGLVDMAWKMLRIAGVVVLILLPFVLFVALFIGYGIYLVFGALVVWLAANVTGKILTYGQAYRLGLHLVTLPLLVSFVVPSLFGVPFLFSIVFFIMAYINFKQPAMKIDAAEAHAAPHAGPEASASGEVAPDAQVEEKK